MRTVVLPPISSICRTTLSQGASVETRGPKSYRTSSFEQYDAITFVVIVLNFLREDASPLLTPATSGVQEGALEGISAGDYELQWWFTYVEHIQCKGSLARRAPQMENAISNFVTQLQSK